MLPLRLTSVSRTFCFAKLRSLPMANVRYFFARFDLMKRKDYGIMEWYENSIREVKQND